MSDFDPTPLNSLLSEFAPRGRSALLPALEAAQALYGYLPETVAAEVGRALDVPLADVYGVIDFYAMLYTRPVGRKVLRVCTDPACAMAGGETVLDALCHYLGVQPNETSADGGFTVERAPCLGLCEHAPAVLAGDIPIANADPGQAAGICQGHGKKPVGIVGGDLRLLTANCGSGHTTSLEAYTASGGYRALRKAFSLAPVGVIAEVKASGLVGRGGAAFPAGVKWEGAAQAPAGPKYVVCNADESEPGTFKDRVLMEEDPHRILEGMTIAAYAVGAHQGYIYVRGEYISAFRSLSQALDEARKASYLGKDILGSGFDFDIELSRGAGAYVCGEETALFESMEGKRGFPRVKPPFPTTFGLFGKPTVINNVETLCNVPTILDQGSVAYRRIGTEKSPGPKLFCLSGDVVHPGLYETPLGSSLRHLIYDLAGGLRSGRSLQAVLLGGAAGSFASPDQLDVAMSFESLASAGLSLGSGVVMVIDDSRDLRDILLRLGRFFADESCGKCYPCRLGTQRQYEILQRVADGGALEGDVERLMDVSWTMSDASICALGQMAGTAVLSALRLWPALFEPKM
jgi:NADH-quinone oxidoreductase subunit F